MIQQNWHCLNSFIRVDMMRVAALIVVQKYVKGAAMKTKQIEYLEDTDFVNKMQKQVDFYFGIGKVPS